MSFRGKEFIELDGNTVESMGVFLKDRPEIPTAEREVEYIEVRGRDGALTKKYSYKDVECSITFHMYVDEGGGFMTPFRLVKNRILDAETLVMTDDPSVYRKIKNVIIDDTYSPTYEFGRFPTIFILDPFWYEFDNDVESLSAESSVNNPGYEALPKLKAQVNGTGRIYVNGEEIVIQDVNGSIIIDSELQNAYREGNPPQNMNHKMVGRFPVLKSGTNDITYEGDITSLEIVKNVRWR